VLVFIPLYRLVGQIMIALAVLPVAATASVFGMRAGLLASLLAFPLNILLVTLVRGTGQDMMTLQGLIGSVLILLLGAMIGRLRDLGEQVRKELTEHRQAEEALRESEERFRDLFESAPDAVFVQDFDGYVLDVNPAACRLHGIKRGNLMGRNVTKLVPPDKRGEAARDSLQLAQGELDHIESFSWTEDGRAVPVEIRGSRIDYSGEQAVLLYVRDITKRKQAEEALRQHAAELEARNEELDAFAHTVAHDLKGPLGPMVGFAQLLEDNYTTLSDEEQRDYLQIIAESGRKMSNIIDELLLLSALRGVEAEMVPLDMASIVDEVRQRLAYMIKEYQAEILLPDAWPVPLGYGPWVEEVWANYLSNALKYGGQSPHVELGATVQADGMVRFWIRDNGPGLTPEEQARLFTPFTRLEQVQVKGHGLGLSIVRRIVEKLDGQVGIESQVGQGSVFTFTLRMANDE